MFYLVFFFKLTHHKSIMYLSQLANTTRILLLFILTIGILVITLTNCEIICSEDNERPKMGANDTDDNSLLDVSLQHLRMWMFMNNKRIDRKFEEIQKYNSHKLDGVMHTLFRAVNTEKGEVKRHTKVIKELTRLVSRLNVTVQIARQTGTSTTTNFYDPLVLKLKLIRNQNTQPKSIVCDEQICQDQHLNLEVV
uniref:Uncharacterized protein n=1 Tax=Strigamia maritima TaxID=126957 RepID=T1IU92_STRMM